MINFLFFLIIFSSKVSALCLPGTLEKPLDRTYDLKGAEEVTEEFESFAKRELPVQLSLVILLEALNPRVNAEIIKTENEVSIKVMGGMLMHPRMNHDTLKLLLCHEIGHYLGGPPHKMRNGWSSTEGQADFYSSLECVRRLGFDETSFIDSAINLTSIYAEVTRESFPRLDSCDDRQVERTNYGYPSVQCRLDTLISGWQGKDRPRCWFKE